MKIGVYLMGPPNQQHAPGAVERSHNIAATPFLRDLAVHAEQLGFDSFWLPDHVVMPVDYDSDYPYQALSGEEREAVERRVNELVFENRPVHVFETPIDEARRLGATMLFGEKYGDVVRVVEVPGYSIELCGGTHVTSTAEIGPFVLLSESSVGSGARRVEAVTSGAAWAVLDERSRELEALRAEVERLRKAPKAAAAAPAVPEPEPEIRVENDVNVIVQPVDGLDADALLELSDRYKQKHAPAAVVLGSREDGRVHLVANFDDSIATRVSASDVVRAAAAIVGGGGGGRPTMARAGGKDPEKLPDALAEAERLIISAL